MMSAENVVQEPPITQHDEEHLKPDVYQWTLVPNGTAESWNSRLLRTDAHICQYPLWNDSLRRSFLKPQYVIGSKNGSEIGYACVIAIGILGLKFGLVRGGPVSLAAEGPLSTEALQALLDWAYRHGYIFLFFSHESVDVLERLAVNRSTERSNPAMWGHIGDEWVVDISESDDEKLLRRFAQIARRDIRKAQAAGFRVTSSVDPTVLESRWALVRRLEQRKHMRYGRSLKSYKELFTMAVKCNAAKVYTVELEGQPLEMLVVVRDRDTAHYIVGALDVPQLGDAPTPSCLAHWTAMREFRAQGVQRYNLGSSPIPKVAIFKRKFHPTSRKFAALTVILRPQLYTLSRVLFRSVWRARRFLTSPQALRRSIVRLLNRNKKSG